MRIPLADRLRPKCIQEVVGQQHLLGPGRVLARLFRQKNITNMIFYGPPGTGKTTVAMLAADLSDRTFYKLNATNASLADIKLITGELDSLLTSNGVLLYLDEIQNFNKKQQQSLLEYMENGKITLIASTTENPYHYIYKAILSRAHVFEFKEVVWQEILPALERGLKLLNQERNLQCADGVLEYLAKISGGDVRKALNSLELMADLAEYDEKLDCWFLTLEEAEASAGRSYYYDRSGDGHYDLLSALQKSIRGSDPDASIYYLANLLQGGDLASVCRRLLVIAAEDIGLAYPQALAIVKSAVDSAFFLGLPEARIPLAEAVLLLANAPKSNSALLAVDAALASLKQRENGRPPVHLLDAHYAGAEKIGHGKGYLYPHDYPYNYIQQQYLPDSLVGTVYYKPGKNKVEENMVKYWKEVKKKCRQN